MTSGLTASERPVLKGSPRSAEGSASAQLLFSVGVWRSVVGEDVGGVDPEALEGDALGGEVLFVCGRARLSDQ